VEGWGGFVLGCTRLYGIFSHVPNMYLAEQLTQYSDRFRPPSYFLIPPTCLAHQFRQPSYFILPVTVKPHTLVPRAYVRSNTLLRVSPSMLGSWTLVHVPPTIVSATLSLLQLARSS
jgi:hypothetical protein